MYAELIFISVNDDFATSNQAIEQFLQTSAPGEGYAFPTFNGFETDENGQEKPNIVLTEGLLYNNGITEIQFELFGANIFVAPLIMGRRVKAEDNKIQAPTILFPYQMETPIPSDVNKSTSGENNYYLIEEATISLIQNFTN